MHRPWGALCAGKGQSTAVTVPQGSTGAGSRPWQFWLLCVPSQACFLVGSRVWVQQVSRGGHPSCPEGEGACLLWTV